MNPVDQIYRITALEQAVAVHTADGYVAPYDNVLATAGAYLSWLRRPTPPARLQLHIGPAVPAE